MGTFTHLPFAPPREGGGFRGSAIDRSCCARIISHLSVAVLGCGLWVVLHMHMLEGDSPFLILLTKSESLYYLGSVATP